MCTILAVIGLLVVLKIAFAILFPVTHTRLQMRMLVRNADRMLEATVRELEDRARKQARR